MYSNIVADITMEEYTSFIERHASSAVHDTWSELASRLEKLRNTSELDENIRKRLGSTSLAINSSNIRMVVHLVLCSRGYGLNHLTLRNVDASTFMVIWEFIDTLKVSSSPSLQAVIRDLVGHRDSRGYAYDMSVVDTNPRIVLERPTHLQRVRLTKCHDQSGLDFMSLNHMLIIDRSVLLGRGLVHNDVRNLF